MYVESFFRDTRFNMYISWVLTLSVLAVFFESLADLDLLWILFSGFTLAVLVIPPFSYKNLKIMLPWEVILLAVIPILVRTFQISVLANEIATYTAFAGLALIIAVELHVFTNVKFNHAFAILFTVISTLAIAGLWAILRFQMDIYLGTSYLSTNQALMDEFAKVLAAGTIAGIMFDTYFRKRDSYFRKGIEKVIGR